VAYAAGDGLDQDFAVLRFVEFDILDTERQLRPVENGGFHPECSLSVAIVLAARAADASSRGQQRSLTTTLTAHFQCWRASSVKVGKRSWDAI
jgi:hypothetical protein